MKKINIALKLFCAAAFSFAFLQVNAQNIVVDPGFENSTDSPFGNAFVPPWVVNDSSMNSNVGGNPSFAHSGNNYANLGTGFPPNTNVATLTQTLNTITGTFYTLSFWLANNNSDPVNFFEAYFGGTLVFSTTSLPFPNNGVYQLVNVGNLQATSTSTVLQFRYRHDQDFWRLDDVSVRTPEGGASLWLLAPVFAGLCLLYSRSVRRSTSLS